MTTDQPGRVRFGIDGALLFFPGNRPGLLAKAVASGAHAVCVDLEDSVPEADKLQARRDVIAMLGDRPPGLFGIRINSPRTVDGLRDLVALVDARAAGVFVVVPKVDDAAEARLVNAVLRNGGVRCPLVAAIETPGAVHRVDDIAAATGVSGLLFGAEDFSAATGAQPESETLMYPRSRIVCAAAIAGITAVDTPWMTLNDQAGLVAAGALAKRMGFAGKAAIHPAQVASIQSTFEPTPRDVARAKAILSAAATRPLPLVIDGRLVEHHAVEAAYALVARALALQTLRESP